MDLGDQYSVRVPGSKVEGLSLYEAMRTLAMSPAKGDAFSHISRDGRAVCFWCNWDGCLSAMFGANELERGQIGADSGLFQDAAQGAP